ncbi:MAG: sulfite exporter TauE/SafE family protein, partial [Halomonas sp.]
MQQGNTQKDGIVSIKKEKAGIFECKIYTTNNKVYKYSPRLLGITSFVVGIIGTAYGIGGGAIIAPFCISVLGFPVFLVSGAALFSTWINSIIAAIVYSFNSNTTPDLLLGALFGVGGMIGIYIGTY